MNKIGKKIILLSGISSLIVSVTIGIILTISLKQMNDGRLKQTKEMFYQNFDRNARLEVEAAISILKNFMI